MPNWVNHKAFFVCNELHHVKMKINSHVRKGVRTSILIFRLLKDYAPQGTPWM